MTRILAALALGGALSSVGGMAGLRWALSAVFAFLGMGLFVAASSVLLASMMLEEQ